MRENARHSRERDDDAVRLWTTREARRRYDDFATLYALARALEKLERAYVRSSVDAKAYERACVDLTSKFKTLRSVLRDSVPDLDRFLETYGARVPAARRRLEAGVPATAEHGGAARGTEAEGRAEARAVADATHCFIGVMDTVKLDMRAKDQVAPALGDLLLALCKVSRLPNDFEGTKCVRKWVLRLDEMRASEVLEEEETREFLYEIANAYSTLLASLGDVRALDGSYVCGFVSPRWRTRYVGTNRSNHADAFRSSFAENDARPFAQKFRPVAPLECHHGSIAHALLLKGRPRQQPHWDQ